MLRRVMHRPGRYDEVVLFITRLAAASMGSRRPIRHFRIPIPNHSETGRRSRWRCHAACDRSAEVYQAE